MIMPATAITTPDDPRPGPSSGLSPWPKPKRIIRWLAATAGTPALSTATGKPDVLTAIPEAEHLASPATSSALGRHFYRRPCPPLVAAGR
jgi:hypothetical protein